MRISDWSSDLCSSDLHHIADHDVEPQLAGLARDRQPLGQPAALVELDVDDIEAADKRGRVGERQCAFVGDEGQGPLQSVEVGLCPARQRLFELRHPRSEEHQSELPLLIRTSYDVYRFQKKNTKY